MNKLCINKTYQTIGLLLLTITIHCTRSPEIIMHGRFWAEEGETFFHNAWIMPPLKALFVSYGGYLNLTANAVPLIAKWSVPLAYAPYVTMGIGLLFQLLPLFLLLTATDQWLISFKNRLFATLLLLFVPETLEISLQSLHIQFSLTLACAIIVMLDISKSRQRWFKLSILLLSALSGVMTLLLLPLFLLQSIFQRNWLRIEQFIVLCIGNIIQFVFFYTPFHEREYHASLSEFLSIFFIKDIYIPFLGNNSFSNGYSLYIEQLFKNHQVPILSSVLGFLVITILLGCVYRYPKTRPSGFLIAYALLNLGLSIIGSIGPKYWFFEPYFNQRYAFISQSLLSITLLYFSSSLPKPGQILCNLLMVWLIIASVNNYYHYISYSYGVPPWQEQVELWKKNPNYTFQIWPKGWTMKLPKTDD
ncbi:hypothetical protein [Commensalibacter oyaizuii]|uniref:DUF2029 domain-containing protein n=1 Tax=Commensalibacter oyaizuii TaxID=3043873 RepID=A0ABT6Q075_9PROT|nr:hypothetical protein [Commensalibacter sp. TBRC 16381]MDI2090131.1 hypothetical protein [Commensalibacter sp. TBRC 16381]